jgi:hypothetical protein
MRYSRLQALYLAFYSRDLYRDVARNWTGIGFLYLLLLLGLTWLPSAVRTFNATKTFAEEKGAAMAQQLPTVTIRDGTMRANPSGRHELKDPSTGEVFLIIDDTIDDVPPESAADGAVLTRNEFGTFNRRRGERRVWKLGPGLEMEVTAAKAQSFLAGFPYWGAPVMYAGALAGSLAFRLAQVLLYGSLGMFFARRFKAAIDYKDAVRLAAVAITPVVVLRTLIWFLPREPIWYVRWPIAFIITFFVIRFAVRAAAEPEPVVSVPTYPA